MRMLNAAVRATIRGISSHWHKIADPLCLWLGWCWSSCSEAHWKKNHQPGPQQYSRQIPPSEDLRLCLGPSSTVFFPTSLLVPTPAQTIEWDPLLLRQPNRSRPDSFSQGLLVSDQLTSKDPACREPEAHTTTSLFLESEKYINSKN